MLYKITFSTYKNFWETRNATLNTIDVETGKAKLPLFALKEETKDRHNGRDLVILTAVVEAPNNNVAIACVRQYVPIVRMLRIPEPA